MKKYMPSKNLLPCAHSLFIYILKYVWARSPRAPIDVGINAVNNGDIIVNFPGDVTIVTIRYKIMFSISSTGFMFITKCKYLSLTKSLKIFVPAGKL